MILTLKTRALLSTVLSASVATAAWADTTIGSDRSTPVITSSAGDVTLVEEVNLDVTGSTPITIDSNNTVTIEEDAVVQADGADGRAGIHVIDGTDFSIVNAGSILVTEDFVPEDDDSNSIPDDTIAEASGRYGIHVISGAPTSGSIENEGTITVEGLSSYGIAIDSAFTGDIVNGSDGDITVMGDFSTALSTQSVDGDVTLGGTITAVGKGTRVADIQGDVSGTLKIDGSLTKAVSFTNDDDASMTLSRAALREVAPAVAVTGNVSGGIIVSNQPYDLDDTDDDENNNGIDDDEEGVGAILSYGESPALVIGGAADTTIGTVQGRDGEFSLVVDGSVQSSGYYSSFDSTAVVIGGQGGNVSLPGGIGVSGTIQATTNDFSATALLINPGSTVQSLYVSGMIRANVQSTGEAAVTAVKDLSGTLTTIDNTGYIYANGSSEDETNALDLTHNTSGVTIRQYLNDIDADAKADQEDDDDYDPDNPTIYAGITGDIRLGSGDDLLDASTGLINGDTYFGDGDDRLTLSDDAKYSGDVHAGAGAFEMSLAGTSKFYGALDAAGEAAQLTISDSAKFSGAFENGANIQATVNGGTLEAADGETLTFDTLDVGADSAISVVLNGEDHTSSSFDVNSATFADGAKLYAVVTSLADVEGTYTVLTADTLTGLPDLDLTSDIALPLLYSGTLTSADNTLTLDVQRRTAEDLGLSRPQDEAFDAIIAAAMQDDALQASLLEATDIDTLASQFGGLLPDYSGGVFDFVTRSSRLAARHLMDTGTTYDISPVGAWIEPIYFTGSKDAGETAGFKNKGWGISGGLERNFGFGYLGLALDYVQGTTTNGDLQTINEHVFELAGHWRLVKGPFKAFARVSGAKVSMSEDRTFSGTVSDADFSYSTAADWSGWALSGMAGASYDLKLGQRLSIRPKAVVDYFRLKENGYEESGNDAVDLTVDDRTSSAAAATTTMTLSYRMGDADRDETPFTIEFEGGWRSVIKSNLGSTTAFFSEDGDDNTDNGDPFTLTPDALKGGWTTEARILAGGYDFTWQLSAGAEKTQGGIDMSARAGFSIAF